MNFNRLRGRNVFSAFLLSTILSPIFSQGYDFGSLLKEFKSGNYTHVASQSKLALQDKSSQPSDLRFLVLYISSESNLEEMDKVLESVYQSTNHRPKHLMNAMYLILERCLVANSVSMGEKWGYRFRQEAEYSSRYAEGLYYYASLLYQNKKDKDALFISNLALNHKPNSNLTSRLELLQAAIKQSSSKR